MTSDTSVALGVVLRNMTFLLRTLPIVGWKAQRHLEISVREARELDMPGHLARCLCSLGQVHLARKNSPAARACLEEARTMAQAFEAKFLCDKIDAALDELGPRRDGGSPG